VQGYVRRCCSRRFRPCYLRLWDVVGVAVTRQSVQSLFAEYRWTIAPTDRVKSPRSSVGTPGVSHPKGMGACSVRGWPATVHARVSYKGSRARRLAWPALGFSCANLCSSDHIIHWRCSTSSRVAVASAD
jgi:hypothetical protein